MVPMIEMVLDKDEILINYACYDDCYGADSSEDDEYSDKCRGIYVVT